jgi:type II secretion system protein N
MMRVAVSGLKRIFKGFASWALYCLALVVLFFLLTFPYEQLQARVLAELSRASGVAVTAERWSLAWPAGIEWRNVVLTGPDIPRLQLGRFLLSLRPGSLLEGRPILAAKAELRGSGSEPAGRLTGKGTLRSWSRPALSHLTASVERVDLRELKLPALSRGLLRVEVDQQWTKPAGPVGGASVQPTDGRWLVEVTDVQLEPVPVGPVVVPSVGLSSLTGRLRCSEVTCRIETLEGHGSDGTLNGGGTLLLRSPLPQSELTLSVAVVMSPEYAQRAAVAGLALATPNVPINVTLRGPILNLQVAL